MAQYYIYVSGELENAIEAAELLRQSYPRYAPAHNVLATVYGKLGQNEKAVEEFQATIDLDPNWVGPYSPLALHLTRLGRLTEAREVLEQAASRKLDSPYFHYNLFMIAFILGDETGMKEQMDWESAKPIGSRGFGFQNSVAAFSGHIRQVQEFSRREIERAQSGNAGAAANIAAQDAMMNAFLGICRQAREIVAQALTSARGNSAKIDEAITLAMCGELGQAQFICNELGRQNPKDTSLNAIWLPTIRAVIEIRKDNAAAAIQLLLAAGPYEAAGSFSPTYVRAQAYLRQKSGAEARAEFQKILDHRGWDPTSYLYPLANLGLARAAWLTGDVAGSRKSYQDFFAVWKDADADLPILIEAKKEFAALNR
jgi:eukaryotic-like serine/threonine-protein kinase